MSVEPISPTESVETASSRVVRVQLEQLTDPQGRPMKHPDEFPGGGEWQPTSGAVYGRAWRVTEVTNWQTSRVLGGEHYVEDDD
jgi:hypothetical protein